MANLSQFGLIDINHDEEIDDQLSDNDSDLEAELLNLTGNSEKIKPNKAKKVETIPQSNLDTMVQNCLKEPLSEDDEDNDEVDPEYLNELLKLSNDGDDTIDSRIKNASSKAKSMEVNGELVKLLENRLSLYKQGENEANETNDTSRMRRFQRAIKTLESLMQSVQNGEKIDENEIPPEIKLKSTSKNETDQSDDLKQILEVLTTRQGEYKKAAVQCKRMNAIEQAKEFVKIVKKFDIAIDAVKNGQQIDLNEIPDSPEIPVFTANEVNEQTRKEENSLEQSSTEQENDYVEKTVEDALERRLDLYKKQQQKAIDANDSSKARRFGRICKQFEDAIKAHKSGKHVAFEELPVPPGFIPIEQIINNNNNNVTKNDNKPKSDHNKPTNHSAKQLKFLLQKQKEFKLAALKAKNNGDLNQAKEYLRTAKGFDALIEASQRGAPVDISSIPILSTPQSAIVQSDDGIEEQAVECKENEVMDILNRAELQLTKQLQLCLNTRDHFKSIGDLNGVNKFEKLALSVTKDLDIIRLDKMKCDGTVPKLRYEHKQFSVVKCNTDIPDNELEIMIVRGINYNCSNPRDIDTYVKFEFPYPKDTPVSNQTVLVKNTNNPEYNATYNIPISRSSRSCLRIFKRGVIKFEVYSKGWFFLSDKLLGTVSIKMNSLETQCEIHDCFEILDGRKPTGGKLELKIRLRNPLLTNEVKEFSEKWLSINV